MIKKLINIYRKKARKKRKRFFFDNISLSKDTSILDLGGADGNYIASIVGNKFSNVCVADISRKKLKKANLKYGFDTILLDESGNIPKFWDVIFCSSVIEHVTVDKNQIYEITSTKEFERLSFERQKKFANEIRSKCNSYFVQTPYKYFLFESHTWLPNFLVFLPRSWQIKVIKLTNMFWIKKANPDFRLLSKKGMKELFPDAKIVEEKSFGFTKSLIAIKNSSSES